MNYKNEVWDTVYLIALQGFNYLAPLIVMPYLMVVLGSEKFGYIGFSLSIIQYLMLIVDFGFNLSATKRVALAKNDQVELNKIFSSTLIAKIGLLCLSFLILLIFAFAIPRFSNYSSTMMILFIMVISNAFSFVWLFQGIGKIRIISIVNVVSKLTILPLTFFFVKTPSDYEKAALIQALVYFLGSFISSIIIIKQKYITTLVASTMKQVYIEIKSSFPIFLSSAATSIYTATFIVVLGYYSSAAEVGRYAAGEKIMRAFTFLIFAPISQSFYPKISAMSEVSKENALILIKKILIFLGILMSGVFGVLFFLSGYFTDFLGKDYQGTNSIFKILALTPLFISLGGALGQFGLLALGNSKDKINFQNSFFVAAIVAIILMFSLIPTYHAIGASIALLITEFVVFFMMLWYNRKNIKMYKLSGY